MRRNNFLIGAVAALVTFAGLSAFVDRPWGWHHRWHDRHHHHYYDDNDRNDDRPQNRKTDSTNY